MCSVQVLLKMTRSSKYAAEHSSPPFKTWSIIFWNIAGTPCNPKGKTVKWNNPRGGFKGSVGSRCWVKRHLPVNFTEIESSDELGSANLFQQFIHSGHWIWALQT